MFDRIIYKNKSGGQRDYIIARTIIIWSLGAYQGGISFGNSHQMSSELIRGQVNFLSGVSYVNQFHEASEPPT